MGLISEYKPVYYRQTQLDIFIPEKSLDRKYKDYAYGYKIVLEQCNISY